MHTVAESPTYDFSKGLVTDQSPVNPVPGSATDCFDYEIQIDGSIQRRKAMRLESGGSPRTLIDEWQGDEAYAYHLWKAAGGDADRTVVVLQLGDSLFLFEESDKFTESAPFAEISLLTLGVASATETNIRTTQVTLASGRGQLLVASRYLTPTVFSLVGNTISASPIQIQIRDFSDVTDSVPLTQRPLTVDDAALYNLYNRGWAESEITQFFTDKAAYPAKNMVSWLGYIRETDTLTQEGYGTKSWNSDKMAAEVFGTTSAPRGRLLINPFDTRTATNSVAISGVDLTTIAIVDWIAYGELPNPFPATLTLATAHGLTVPTAIVGAGALYCDGSNSSATMYLADQPNLIATPIDATRLSINLNVPIFGGVYDSTNAFSVGPGAAISFSTSEDVSITLTKPDGYQTDERPTVVAWYAGRAWYAGTNHPKLSDSVLFSPLIEADTDLGKCYQRNDPTTESFNAIVDTDGGLIKIPGLSGVRRAEVFGSSLVLFSDSGIWEIRGGQSGFTATSYIVRKVSDNEACSASGVVRTDAGLAFVSKRGLCMVGYDTNSGYLNVSSLTAGRIDTYWGAIPDVRWQAASLAYDDAKKRIYTLIPRTFNFLSHTEALVLDLRFPDGGAYYKLRLPYSSGVGYVAGALGVESGDNPTKNRKVKFVSLCAEGVLKVLDMDHSRFDDEFGEELPPFWESVSDNIKDWTKHKYAAHYVYTHVKRTVMGYVDTGFDMVPINRGACTIQGRWNWADATSSGKYTAPQPMYRDTRLFTPSSETDLGGEPVLVRRHKIRGSGRSINIRVEGTVGFDSHILGWVLQYGVG